MEIIWTRTKTLVSLGLLAGLLVGGAVKHFWFPAADEQLFQKLDYQRLQQASGRYAIFRPTKYEEFRRGGVMTAYPAQPDGHRGEETVRLMGRNASLREIISLAYQCPESRVVLPSDLPQKGYDFLMTRPHARERLQETVKRKLGLVADWQERQAEVIALRARPGGPRGFSAAGAESAPGIVYREGKLHFNAAGISGLIGALEPALDRPLIDQTGLTGKYDFAMTWGFRTQEVDVNNQLLNSALNELGLMLVTNTAPLKLMVVNKK